MIEVSMFQIFVVFMIILYIIRRPHIGKNEPPLVPYTIPILGHTFNYLFNTKKFMKECKELYGECFSIYIFGYVLTVLSRGSVNEVFINANDFDFVSAMNEHIPFHRLFTYNGGLTKESNTFHAKTAREQVSGKIDLNMNIIQKYLLKGIDGWIGDCNVPRIIYNAASHEDLIKSFGDFAFDLGPLFMIPQISSFIHPKLHEFVITLPLKFGWNPVSYHREIVMNRVRPVIEKRLKEKKQLGDKYKPYNDVLEFYMNQPNFDYTDPDNLPYHIENLLIIVFASINTTSRTVIDGLYDLAGRQEILNELYEEALIFDKECNGQVTYADLKRMVKLDSFVKETLRHNDNIFALPHYMTSKSFTFSNGFTIPEGRKIILYSSDTLKSKESFGEDAEEFKPFRFLNKNSPATKIDRSFVVFGGGKHACPGLADFLHGKIEEKLLYGPFTMPSKVGLVFENRVKC
ncbi:cytochrome P450 [Rhizophagus clarus]|uniref:Cytochrome P450 n=1 Tax=Rhizophagus clarus TaxID=94130 RepID=A0A8H3LMB7_9GLOM|nr:cytochrome P450 [Rhizophagus clarus]